jgi:hypothetical protein
MILKRELFKRPVKVPPEHDANIDKLLIEVNKLRLAYGKPLQVSSGYRSLEEHLEIYRRKGITDQKKIPMQSNHLKGLAVDLVTVGEPIKNLHDFVKKLVEDESEVVENLWFEDFAYTGQWCHVQCVPPKSGKKFFKP